MWLTVEFSPEQIADAIMEALARRVIMHVKGC
jgi:hypothetical protein